MKKSHRPDLAVVLLLLVLAFLYALSLPMRHGARFWEAIAVLPQIVLWFVPLVFAVPVLLSFAYRLRPTWTPRAVPRVDDESAGTLKSLAVTIRLARTSHLARTRLISQLIRLGVQIVSERAQVDQDEGWSLFREGLRRRQPDLVPFLDRREIKRMSPQQFRTCVLQTVAFLEQESEEVQPNEHP